MAIDVDDVNTTFTGGNQGQETGAESDSRTQLRAEINYFYPSIPLQVFLTRFSMTAVMSRWRTSG